MTNYSIDSALTAAEGTINIDLVNKATGATYCQTAVLGTNTLGQILNEYLTSSQTRRNKAARKKSRIWRWSRRLPMMI